MDRNYMLCSGCYRWGHFAQVAGNQYRCLRCGALVDTFTFTKDQKFRKERGDILPPDTTVGSADDVVKLSFGTVEVRSGPGRAGRTVRRTGAPGRTR